MSRIILAIALATLCWSGCGSPPPPERAYYLLRAEPPGELTAADPADQIGFAEVSVASYLDRGGIVVQVGERELREASLHLWAEPLYRGIHTFLETSVASKLGRELKSGSSRSSAWQVRVDVRIDVFHGSLGGDVDLAATWSAANPSDGTFIAGERVTATSQQAGEGYPSLVAAHASLLEQLADSIAAGLRDL